MANPTSPSRHVRWPNHAAEDYRVIREAVGSLGSAAAGGSYCGYPGGFILSSSPAAAIATLRLDPALWTPPKGYKLKLFVAGMIVTNGTTPPGSLTWNFRLQAVSAIAGASGALPNVTLGSVVPGSAGASIVGAPAAATVALAAGGADFDPPAAGTYALVCNLSTAIAANANMQIMAQLLRRYVSGDG